MENAQLIQKVYRIDFTYSGKDYFSIITEDLLSDKVNLEVIMDEKDHCIVGNNDENFEELEKITYEKYNSTKKG